MKEPEPIDTTVLKTNCTITVYQAAGQPKEVKWYYAGHEMNDVAALKDRGWWLAKKLGFTYEKVFRGVF